MQSTLAASAVIGDVLTAKLVPNKDNPESSEDSVSVLNYIVLACEHTKGKYLN